MDTPSLLKGHFYPSSRVSRCPKFSPCLVSKKCQNYNQHDFTCVLCESRVRPPYMLGGYLPEGETEEDIQAIVKTLEAGMGRPLAHPDRDSERIDPLEIAFEYDKFRQATEGLIRFAKKSTMIFEVTDE